MELVVGRFLQLLLQFQLPVQRPFRQEQMLGQGVDRQRNRQDTSGGQSSESIMLIRRQLDIQVKRAVDKHESPLNQFDGVNDPLVVQYCDDR